MEATAVSVGKAVLNGTLSYAMSKAAEEIALELGVKRDVDFITDELQMMQSFLEMADEDNGRNKVFITWVKQIRDLAYKVEDSLMDFGLHSEEKPFWGCIPHSPCDRRRIAKEVKELRAKVEDVSNRNLRYHLVKGDKGSTRPTAAEKQANVASAAMIGINESTVTLEQEKSEVTLYQLITSEEEDLRVIAIWGTSGDHGKTSAIQEVYYDPKVLKKFGFCAWVRLMYPFNPQVFLRSLVRQFYENSHDEVGKQESETSVGANVLAKMEKMDQTDLIRVFNAQLCRSSYLIVINDLSTIEERQCIKMYFPNNKKQSRIIVLTQSVETASLCIEKPYQVSELRQLSFDQTIYLLHVKNTEEHSMTSEARHTGMEEKLKVWKDNTKKTDFVPAMMEQARIILKKCDGLPLAISTIGGYLATKPKTAIEWRKMNDRISAQLEINPELRTIKTVLMRSYDGLPYYLKSAFLYLSIFQEDQKVRLARLVRRWTAEGYSQDRHGITAEQLGHRYFGELLDRSMILPGGDVKRYNGKINSCQLHDMIREICILKVREENLVFTLEDGCCLSSTQGPIRHLVIGSNWKRDGDALPSVLDLSHVRSLTVFGEWRPFFISENMRFLRVLDLEDTTKLRDHHLDRVVKLHHLKYLSLRGCFNIFCLPNSLGNLRHLQTLDVRGTRIFELPTTITNLGKLQNLCAPDFFRRTRNVRGEDDIHNEYANYVHHIFSWHCHSFCLWMSTGPLLLVV
uniref:Uncharacterized protein n=2 Tax=Avena sativa TaxID=4498 RepID=A0ACD5T883_AVESA